MRTFPFAYNLSKRELYDKIIRDVMAGNVKEVHPDVYQAYSENLRKAVGGVLSSERYGDKYFDLQAQLQANVSRFAAYKAYHLTEQLKQQRDKWSNDDDFRKIAQSVINTFNRYQATEYNTATARARTAKQWTDFNADPISNELYPNLKWLPSRSANPREEHIPFYGLVLPKTDPFWQQNQPGNLWNCKCDWEETDDPAATERPQTICAKGLEGNPAKTGEVFTDKCTYFKQAGKNRKERDNVEKVCETATQKYYKKTAKDNPLLKKQVCCEIEGVKQNIHFADWGISETAFSMHGKQKSYWLKNEILRNPDKYFLKAHFVKSADVDLSHNTGKTLKLKNKFKKFYYLETQLSDGQFVYLNIVLHNDTKYYLYTVSKNIPSYEKE